MKVQSPVNQTINQSAKNVYVSVRNFPPPIWTIFVETGLCKFFWLFFQKSQCLQEKIQRFKQYAKTSLFASHVTFGLFLCSCSFQLWRSNWKVDPGPAWGFYAQVYFAINSGVNSGVKCSIKIGFSVSVNANLRNCRFNAIAVCVSRSRYCSQIYHHSLKHDNSWNRDRNLEIDNRNRNPNINNREIIWSTGSNWQYPIKPNNFAKLLQLKGCYY